MPKPPDNIIVLAITSINIEIRPNFRKISFNYDGDNALFRFYCVEEPSEDDKECAEIIATNFDAGHPKILKSVELDFVVTNVPPGKMGENDFTLFSRWEPMNETRDSITGNALLYKNAKCAPTSGKIFQCPVRVEISASEEPGWIAELIWDDRAQWELGTERSASLRVMSNEFFEQFDEEIPKLQIRRGDARIGEFTPQRQNLGKD